MAAAIAPLTATIPPGFVLASVSIGLVSLCLLSFIYFLHSLNRDFAGERLLPTLWTADAIGPVRFGGAAIGLVPAKQGVIAR